MKSRGKGMEGDVEGCTEDLFWISKDRQRVFVGMREKRRRGAVRETSNEKRNESVFKVSTQIVLNGSLSKKY